jgi:hypothetical protein
LVSLASGFPWSCLVVIIPCGSEPFYRACPFCSATARNKSNLAPGIPASYCPVPNFPYARIVWLAAGLQVRIFFVRQWHSGSICQLLVVLIHQLLVDLDLGRSKGNFSDKLQSLVANELAGEPEERFLEVVV